MVIKLSMYVGLHDVYPVMDVNLAFWREVKMTAVCNFISLGEEMCELLDKNGKKEKRKRGKSLITWLDKKGAKFARCVVLSVFWRSWMKADKGCSRFQPLDALWMKKHNFWKISTVITSGITWYFLETFLIFVLSGWEGKWSRHYGCRN